MQKAVLPLIVFFVGLTIGATAFGPSDSPAPEDSTADTDGPQSGADASPYAGQETREIVSLSDADLESLMEGSGVAFGGMAKFAELNGYPGPRHVLELKDDLELTAAQLAATEALFEEMRTDAISFGEDIIEAERSVDVLFKQEAITGPLLESGISESAEIYGRLRNVHLQAHLAMMDILTDEQVDRYNELRGYTGLADPCETVPEGHDPELWLLHHGCA